MNKREYLKIAMGLPLDWLKQCANEPSKHMRPIHIALIRLAIRKRVG